MGSDRTLKNPRALLENKFEKYNMLSSHGKTHHSHLPTEVLLQLKQFTPICQMMALPMHVRVHTHVFPLGSTGICVDEWVG